MRTGAWGEIRDAQGFCQPIGIGGLAQWRDRNYRNPRRDRSRARAQYTIMEKGPEFALARGNFPLANLMGFRGDDVVAVIMNDDACAPPLSRDVSTMEFRTRGSYALMLLSDAGSCAIDGLVIPQ